MADLQARLQSALGDAYHIERELGGGGMSRLFLATEASLHRQVVIKLLPPEFASEVSAARFKQEIELAAHLQHPNILPVLTAGAKDDLLFYVMPFVSGESLRHRLTREGKLPVADALRILHEVADALAHAHAEGVIHRDIKPENILLEGGHAVLTDFGVARALAESRSGGRLTDTGLALGTPGYMSPEQAAGERHVDARADVYALAVVGYEMLAGFPPFAGPTAQAVIAAHLTATPRPLTDTRPETPAAVANAVARALAKDPNARLRTAAEFRDAMGAAAVERVGRRVTRPWVLAAGVAGLAAVAAVLVIRPRSSAPLDPNLVAVAPFNVLDPKLELWHEGLVDVLSRNLDGAGTLRTVPPSVAIKRSGPHADASAAAEVGRRTGARLVVFGTLTAEGPDSVRLTASVFDVGAGRVVTDVERRDLSDRMNRLADSLTIALLRELSGLQPGGLPRLGSVGTASLPALKAFLQGEQYFRRTDWDSALAYYQRAIAFDSTFALALRHASLVLGWARSGFDSLSRAYALQAGRFVHGLAPRESLLVTADSLSEGVWGVATDSAWRTHVRRLFATLEEAVRRYPNDPEAWYELGDARYHWGPAISVTEREALAAFDRSIALDSALAPTYIHPIELGLLLAGPTGGRRYADAYLALKPTDASAAGMRLVARLFNPDERQSSETAHLLDTLPADGLSNAWFPLRRWPDSAETQVRLAQRLVATSRPGSAAPFTTPIGAQRALSAALAYRGHLRKAYRSPKETPPAVLAELAVFGAVPADTAAAVFRRWLRNDTLWTAFALPWWSQRGDTMSLHEVLRRAEVNMRSGPSQVTKEVWAYGGAAARAYLARARHDTAQALRALAALPDSLCPVCYLIRLEKIESLERFGRDREAASLLVHLPYAGFIASPIEGLWVLERGRVNERLGNREKAIAAYRFVADVWRNADAELQPYVAEARAALKRLSGEPR